MRDKNPDALSYSHTNGGGRVVLVLVAPMSHLLVDKRIRVILAECDGQGSAGGYERLERRWVFVFAILTAIYSKKA